MSSRRTKATANVPPVRRAVLVASLLALAAGGSAQAALVARSADDAVLALAQDGSPRVAYAANGELFLATRRRDGAWTRTRVGRLPAGTPRLAGLEIVARGRPYVLVEDADGRWLTLADRVGTRWRLRAAARGVPADAVLGPAGLELDRVGKPAVAYAFRLPDRKTFLRIVTGGNFRTIPITREGFPESATIPAAAPVLMPDGKLRVLETYSARGGGAILWRHAGTDWRGLFLSSSVGGTSPVGPVFARASGTAFAAAWTLAGPIPGELQARVAPRPDRPQSDVLHRRALVEGLALAPEGPVLAATEPVSGLGAGLLLGAGGAVELDGRLLGVEVAPDAFRHLLVVNAGGLSWYGAPAAPALRVSLDAAASADGAVQLSGTVTGVVEGTVTVYRELPGSPRTVAGTAALAADGSFALTDMPLQRPVFYRAVYEEPVSGIPYAALLRRAI